MTRKCSTQCEEFLFLALLLHLFTFRACVRGGVFLLAPKHVSSIIHPAVHDVTLFVPTQTLLHYNFDLFFLSPHAGGNQRDLARAKNQKKLADQNKGVRTDNLTVEQRKARYGIVGIHGVGINRPKTDAFRFTQNALFSKQGRRSDARETEKEGRGTASCNSCPEEVVLEPSPCVAPIPTQSNAGMGRRRRHTTQHPSESGARRILDNICAHVQVSVVSAAVMAPKWRGVQQQLFTFLLMQRIFWLIQKLQRRSMCTEWNNATDNSNNTNVLTNI